MNAWVLHDIGDIRFETVDEPILSDDEVLLEVKAVGICGSDIPRVYRSGTYSYPLIPGHEFSGIVKKTGRNVDNNWLHKRVGVFPLIPCKNCIQCKKKQYEMCSHYSYLGSRQNGAFAEFTAVPADNLIEIPEQISYEEAAMMEPMAVAVHAMRTASPSRTDTVVICGLGTIGMLLLMFLMEAGIKKIFVIGNKEFQKIRVQKLGLAQESYCDSYKQDAAKWIAERSNGIGANVFFECVGTNETTALAINASSPGGRVCLVGNPSSDMKLEKGVYWQILRKQLTLKGTWNSSFTQEPDDDWHYILDRMINQRISPADLITHRYPLEDFEQGLLTMKEKTADYIKIMTVR